MFFSKGQQTIYVIALIFISFFINFYYGHQGVYPLDTFLFYDSSIRILNGKIPIKDFWTSTGITIDLIQYMFFEFFGISFKTYVVHASLMNLILTLSTFFILRKFKLSSFFSFFYSVIFAIIAYPLSGTPFLDHHAIFFCILAIYSYIAALIDKKVFFWCCIPIFLLLAFFSKQTPSAYLSLFLVLSILMYFYFNFSLKLFSSVIFSSLFFLALILFLLLIYEIKISDLYNQYISYPSYIGEIRMNEDAFLTPVNFSRYILKFKFIHLAYFLLLFILISIIFNKNFLNNNDFYVLSVFITFSLILIFHQLLSLNQKFVDLIVPILLGFSHIYLIKFKEIFKKKFSFIQSCVILISIIFLVDVFFNYIDNRRFMDLKKVDLSKAIDAENIDPSLKGLKWITYLYPENPNKEIELINKTLASLKMENNNFILLTHYSFLHNLIGEKSFNTTRVHDEVSVPLRNEKNFDDYRNKFNKIILDNEIKKIYIVKPLSLKSIDGIIESNCLKEKRINEILISFKILTKC